MIRTLSWNGESLNILDQRLLPHFVRYIRCTNHKQVAKSIRDMALRGAPLIGVSAAFGVALASNEKKFSSVQQLSKYLSNAIKLLAMTRPTAVNLFWALNRMKRIVKTNRFSVSGLRKKLSDEAESIYEQDVETNRKIGENGAKLLGRASVILTHCNAGALATAGYGTALGVIRSADRQNKVKLVYVDETRPYLQGARLTAWELKQEKIPFVLITDNMAGHFMKTGRINAVIVGADRIAANGDTANKIGTYSIAVLAKYHKIPFFVAAPVSTIDLKTKSGDKITIEERSSDEVLYINGKSIAPKSTIAKHPAFDVTPADLITAIITEKGVFKPHECLKSREGA